MKKRFSSDVSAARSAHGSPSPAISGYVQISGTPSISSRVAAQRGIRSQREGCAPGVRTSGVTRHACDAGVCLYTKIGILLIKTEKERAGYLKL